MGVEYSPTWAWDGIDIKIWGVYGGQGGLSLFKYTKWNYLPKGWHPVDNEIKDKLHVLVPSLTQVMLLYVCHGLTAPEGHLSS